MYYEAKNGRRFTLGSHSLKEWAEAMKKALLALGCSERYAEAEYQNIAGAQPAHTEVHFR